VGNYKRENGNDFLATYLTASLDTMGGLVTNCNAQDLPEGASPRCWDCDFIIGSVFTRAGLSSVYSYASSLNITMLQVGSGSVGTFSYSGNSTPTVNEGFVLQGFSGSAQSLNGQTIFVIYVNAIAGTFTADVALPAGTYINLTGTAVSIVGQFLGPNIPTAAVSVALSGGNAWQTPNNVMGTVGYATVLSGSTVVTSQVPLLAGSLPIGGTVLWNNPSFLNHPSGGNTFASITIAAGQAQNPLIAYNGALAVPADAIVNGVTVAVYAGSMNAGGSLSIQLADGDTDTAVGTAVNIPLAVNSAKVYSVGSAFYQWGTTLTPAMLNGTHLGVIVKAAVTSGSTFIWANGVIVTVYYTLAGSSQVLKTTGYVFSAPSTAGVTGFGVTFQAFTTATNTLSVQLLKNGIAVGQPKTLALTTTPTIYSLGAPSDLWGSTWTYADINNTSFGVAIVASDSGTVSINDLDVLAYITPAQVNFNYVKSYIQDDGQIDTLALDASGLMWKEDVTSAPGALAVVLSGILPGSFAKSATADNNEYIMFSDLAIGTDRPRVYFRGEQFLPLSQGGPGAPPTVVASQSTAGGTLAVTDYSSDGTVITFTFTAVAGFTPVINSLYTIQGTGVAALDNQTFEVVAPVSGTTFTASFVHAPISGSGLVGATAVPTTSYGITSIVQDGNTSSTPLQVGSVPFNGQITTWSAQGQFGTAGTTVRFYYGSANSPQNQSLLDTIAAYGTAYVYIVSTAAWPTATTIGSGTYQVINTGTAIPGFGEHQPVPWFEIAYGSSSAVGGQHWGDALNTGNTGHWQQTLATVTTAVAIPGLGPGGNLTIQGVNTSWDKTWTVLQALKSNVMSISSVSMDGSGVATYDYNVTSVPAVLPAAGEEVTITGTTNSIGAPGIFNTVGIISSASGTQFTVAGFTPPAGGIPSTPQSGAQASTSGTQFTFDPGQTVPNGSSINTIYGNVGATGSVSVTNGAFTPIGQGTRQAVVFFITTSGYETTPSYPVTFDTTANSNFLTFSGVPIGPPDTVARGIAITEAGQNGVPGANFYVIMQPVKDIVNSVPVTYSSTIINDNTTTDNIQFTFTDAVLLNSREIDIQGDNLFNLIELGSAAWVVPYVGRNFYGLQLNKIDNWWTGGSLAFDQGYLPAAGGNIQPLGWSTLNSVDQTLIVSAITGDALYIKNVSGATAPITGMVWQTAYQDYYATAILKPNVTYSVRVSAYIPSGITVGNLVIDLTDYVTGIGAGFAPTSYGSFTVPFSSMSTNDQVFTGTLLTVPFLNQVSPNVQIRVYGTNMAAGADLAVDRIEVFETLTPYLKAQVYGSYANQPEAIDASGTGGIIDTTSENAQPCMGAFVMHNLLYLLKTQSWYSTQDNPNSEPGGWGLNEVSNKVGTIGINSYDTGEEWCITACRSGIYGFDGGQPTKISQELWNLWECINWDAGNTIVLRNDVVSKRLYVAIPLPTGTDPATSKALPSVKWLPAAPYNPTPNSPNVMLMMNYQGLADIKEMMMSPEVHTTMFGTLAAVDMKRKWTIWNIATPDMEFIMQQDGESTPLYICNGIASSKIYKLDQNKYSDDGQPINSLYTTYGFVNAAKAATLPIFGFHRKLYTVFQTSITGGQLYKSTATNAKIRMLPNTLNPKFPYTVPVGIPLVDPAMDDYFRPINTAGNRMFVEVSSFAVGSWFNLSKILITGKADPHSTLNPTGGGNAGIV
jgi:hypothetical protein